MKSQGHQMIPTYKQSGCNLYKLSQKCNLFKLLGDKFYNFQTFSLISNNTYMLSNEQSLFSAVDFITPLIQAGIT